MVRREGPLGMHALLVGRCASSLATVGRGADALRAGAHAPHARARRLRFRDVVLRRVGAHVAVSTARDALDPLRERAARWPPARPTTEPDPASPWTRVPGRERRRSGCSARGVRRRARCFKGSRRKGRSAPRAGDRGRCGARRHRLRLPTGRASGGEALPGRLLKSRRRAGTRRRAGRDASASRRTTPSSRDVSRLTNATFLKCIQQRNRKFLTCNLFLHLVFC